MCWVNTWDEPLREPHTSVHIHICVFNVHCLYVIAHRRPHMNNFDLAHAEGHVDGYYL